MITRLQLQLWENPRVWELLRRFDEIGLPDGWIVAGGIAQTVWNLSCGRPAACGIKDIDVVYFDPVDLSAASEAANERRLADCFRELAVKFDVKNQARVHLWYVRVFGYPIPPYRSTADAIASFPTTATAIGVRCIGGKFECCVPFGLDDLFGLMVRPNRRQITPTIYEAKVNRWRQIWPHLTFLSWQDGT